MISVAGVIRFVRLLQPVQLIKPRNSSMTGPWPRQYPLLLSVNTTTLRREWTQACRLWIPT